VSNGRGTVERGRSPSGPGWNRPIVMGDARLGWNQPRALSVSTHPKAVLWKRVADLPATRAGRSRVANGHPGSALPSEQ